MAGVVQGKAQVNLDGKQAGRELERLEGKASGLRQELIQLHKQDVLDKKQIRLLGKELKSTEKDVRSLKKSTFSYQQVLNNLSGASLKELNKAYRKLRAETSGLNRETDEYKLKASQMSRVQAEIGKVRTEMRGASKQAQTFGQRMGNLADKFNRFAAMGLGVIGMLTGMVFSIRKAVDAFNEFESAEANLSALTGLVGDELKELSASAREMATSVDESGVRITQTAVDIENAFTKVGSQRPELLKNSEALKAVTKDAMILAEASKGDLEPSAIAVTAALNNLDLAAEESRRVINVLAAGSKEGAADIGKLSIAFDKAGTTANLLGLTVEDLVGVTEAVAPKFNDMNKAGNSLDKVFMIMKDEQIGFTNGVFDLHDALNEVRAEMERGTNASDLFGREHAKMVEVLLAEQSEITRYTEAVTGSNTAIEQAIKNTDTNAAKLEQAKNKANENAMVLGEKLAPALTFSTNAFSYLTKALIVVIDNWDTFKKYLITGTVAIVGYTLAIKANTIATAKNTLARKANNIILAIQKAATIAYAGAQALLTGNITRATAAMKLFNKTTKMNPLGLLISLLSVAATALIVFRKKTDEVSKAQQKSNEIAELKQKMHEKTADSIAKEKAELDLLLDIARDETASKTDRKKAIEDINKISPEYLGNITTETINTDKAKEAIDRYTESLEKKAKVMAASQELTNIQSDILQLQTKIAEADTRMNESVGERSNMTEAELKNLELRNDFNSKLVDDYKIQVETLEAKKKVIFDIIKAEDTETDNDGNNNQNTPTPDPDKIKKEADNVLNIISGYRLELLNDAEERDVAELNSWLDKEKKRIESAEGTTEQIAEAKAMLDDQYEQRRSEIEDKYNTERLKKFNQVNEFLKKQQKSLLTDREQIMEAEIESIRNKYDTQIQIAREAMEEDKQNREAYLNMIAQLEATKQDEINTYYHERQMVFNEQHEQARLDALQKYGINRQELLDIEHQTELDKLQSLYEKGTLSHKEYVRAKLKVDREYRQNSLDVVKKGVEGSLEIISLLGDFYSEQKDLELEKAGDNEEKKKEIQKKYADKEFVVTAAQIIAKTALAVMQAFAQLGPVGGAIAAVILGGISAVQIGRANEQRQKVKGLAKGGKLPVTREQDNRVFEAYYDDPFIRGYVNQPRVLVAEEGPEYVVSNDALKNPQVKTFVDALESSRQNGSLRTFDYERAVNSGRKIKGLAEGGYMKTELNTTPSNQEVPEYPELAMILQEIKLLRQDVRNQRNKLQAYISYNELTEKTSVMEEIIETSRL